MSIVEMEISIVLYRRLMKGKIVSVRKSHGKFSSPLKVSGHYPQAAKNKHENRFNLFKVRCHMV